MTDNEIIKTLECCTSKGAKCSDCPAFKKVDRSDCKKYFRGALDLINRQQEEIEKLKDILYDAEGVNLVNYWYQQCEIAENGNRNFDEENKKLKAEIERLKADNKTLENVIKNTFLEKAGLDIDPLAEVKAEAIKEFAERLKEMSEYGTINISAYQLDTLVKEMVGEE